MIDSFVGQVLLRPHLSRAAKLGWAVFLIVGPLAYLGGSILEERGMGLNAPMVSVDRDSARATAQQFAASRGVDTASWTSYASIEPSENLLEYYKLHRDAVGQAAQSFSPAVTARVALVADSAQWAQVSLDQAGRVTAFDFTHLGKVTQGALAPLEQAQAIARTAAESIPNLSGVLTLGKPDVELLNKIGPGCRGFTWHSGNPSLPGISFDVLSTVCGSTPVQEGVTGTVDGEYASAHWGRTGRPLKVLEAIYGLYLTIVVIYSIYRYARRTMEHEISHRRTLILGLVVAASMLTNFASAIDEYVLGVIRAGTGLIWYPLGVVALGFLIVGLGVAVAYGAGEGDLRELYPGKMTSLDALFRGKLLSRNVARSALFGLAYAAWMLVAEGVADWLFRTDAGKFATDLMKLPFFRYPVISLFAGRVVSVTIIAAAGLLLPLAFLGGRVRRARLRTGLMLTFAAMGCLANVGSYGSLRAALIAVSLLTATLVGPFFSMDLLAAIFGLGAFEVATSMARLIALSPSWTQLGAAVGAIGVGVLAVEAWAALHGREYHEEEVRPAYAGNILARQQMQAELAAAREAQLHLLPKSAPEIHGLYITAACIPARIVGGDFYDFFPLDESRLGIFIAEGGNRGIGSALNIALAKGFLMHTVRRNLSPREVIQRLEATLGPLLEGAGAGAATHVAYAVIDTAAGTIRYARTGDYPRVVVTGPLSAEQKVEMPAGTVLYEGSARLRTGDTVLLFTDGIARRVSTTGPAAADGILKALSRKRREYELEDDLTAVVVRITRAGAAMEVVA